MPNKITPSIIGSGDLDQASAGNVALRSLLTKLTTAANAQATKTSTSGKNAPNQSSAAVVFQNPLYIVTFTDPGAGAASLAQAAQRAALASLGANPVNSVIYHQVQAAVSTSFDAGSSLKTYGGESGSLQTQFVMGDLDKTKSWYFRFRTSFDGSTWNSWKIISQKATNVNPYSVVASSINGGQFAGITLPGQQVVGFGMGSIPSGSAIQTAEGVLLANTLGIATPAGYTEAGFEARGMAECSIDSVGVITAKYIDTGGGNEWNATANFLTFGWVAAGAQKLAEQSLSDGGRWVVLTLAGGSRVAIGSGTIASGSTFQVPSGFTAANSMGVCSPAVVTASSNPAYGVNQATVVDGLVTMTFADSTGHVWTSSANWFAIAWESSLSVNLASVAGGKYLLLPTLSGKVALGVGNTASGGVMPLPAGYKYTQCQAFATPATFVNNLTYAMHGVQQCSVDAGFLTSTGTVSCLYGTVQGPRTGSANWFSVAWL